MRFPALRIAILLCWIAPCVAQEREPHLVFLIAEDEYQAARTLPAFAREHLSRRFRLIFLSPPEGVRNDIGGMDALAEADLVILYVRRRSLPPGKMRLFRRTLERGTPLLALRTSSHAWDTRGRGPGGGAEWRDFDPVVLGGNYRGHHGHGPQTVLEVVPGMEAHPVLDGVGEMAGKGSLYRVSPLAPSAQVLLTGSVEGKSPEPILWFHRYGKAPVLYTSLGHPEDFSQPGFNRLLRNAIGWLLDQRHP